MVRNIDREIWALRDLQDDPLEERDFAEADPRLLEEWKLLLNGVRAGLLAPDGSAPTMNVSDETREKLRALGC